MLLDNRKLCCYAKGIFHPNGTPDCVKAVENSERQSGRGLPGKLIRHPPALRLRGCSLGQARQPSCSLVVVVQRPFKAGKTIV
jgi:hypothetical protein